LRERDDVAVDVTDSSEGLELRLTASSPDGNKPPHSFRSSPAPLTGGSENGKQSAIDTCVQSCHYVIGLYPNVSCVVHYRESTDARIAFISMFISDVSNGACNDAIK